MNFLVPNGTKFLFTHSTFDDNILKSFWGRGKGYKKEDKNEYVPFSSSRVNIKVPIHTLIFVWKYFKDFVERR